MKFNIGDRVICIENNPDGNRLITAGMTGTVCDECNEKPGVCFDVFVGGHSCGYKCEDGCGWYVYERELSFESQYEIESDESDLNDFLTSMTGGI